MLTSFLAIINFIFFSKNAIFKNSGRLSALVFNNYMKGYNNNIEKLTLINTNFREVLYTGHHAQLVLMSLKPGEEIGAEVHEEIDQFFRFEAGEGKVIVDDNEYLVSAGSAVIVPSGANHNVINTSETEDLKLYTLYSPAGHKEGIIQATKEEAEARHAQEQFDGQTTE